MLRCLVFSDGNKRTGAAAALVFLTLNDLDFNAQKTILPKWS
jgi:prophage maintenance system killer protein